MGLVPGAYLLVAFALPSLVRGQCQVGWFGDMCQFQCHCQSEHTCDVITGDCGQGDCAAGYFGPQCQYEYLKSHGPAGWLTDHNDSHCAGHGLSGSLKSPLAVDFGVPFIFTWMRVVVKDSAAFHKITIQFLNSEGSNLHPTSPMTRHYQSDTQLDLYGRLADYVRAVRVSGDGVADLCSLYISRGRNLALKQAVYHNNPTSDPHIFVDGSSPDNSGDGQCVQLSPPDEPGLPLDQSAEPSPFPFPLDSSSTEDFPVGYKMTLNFAGPVDGTQFDLVGDKGTEECGMGGLTLTAYQHNRAVFTEQEPELSERTTFTLTPDLRVGQFDSVALNLNRTAWSDRNCTAPALCEFRVWGDSVCEPGYWGRQCERRCQCDHVGEACHVATGACPGGCAGGKDCTKDPECQDPGWFGEGCRYKCRCQPGVACDKDGNCHNDRCQYGWYGPQCQYRNLGILATSVTLGEWLFDGNDTDCYRHHRNGTADAVFFVFTTLVKFTWLRIVVDTPEAYDAINVTFGSANSDNVLDLEPVWLQRVRVSDFAVDLHGRLTQGFREIALEGDGIDALCSVYVSGGRDVAVKQTDNQFSTGRGDDTAPLAIDGDERTCTTLDARQGDSWTVHYQWPVAMTTVTLVTNDRFHCLADRIRLSSEDETHSSLTVTRDTLDTPPHGQLKFYVSSAHDVASLTVTVDQTPDDVMAACWIDRLQLCEAETFGDSDCKHGHWGRDCQNLCACADPKEACSVSTGMCVSGCAPGFYGEGCALKCDHGRWGSDCVHRCSHCKRGGCDPVNGTCRHGCLDGYTTPRCNKPCSKGRFGHLCAQVCPESCAQQDCDNVLGFCRACPSGFTGDLCLIECARQYFGPDCINVCHENCAGRVCDSVTGACQRCLAGRQGDFCNKSCDAGYYGEQCLSMCSKRCKEESDSAPCDPVTGQCLHGCVHGYSGPTCSAQAASSGEEGGTDLPGLLSSAGVGAGLTLVVALGVVAYKKGWFARLAGDRTILHAAQD